MGPLLTSFDFRMLKLTSLSMQATGLFIIGFSVGMGLRQLFGS